MKINLPDSYTLENTGIFISKNPRKDLLAGAGSFSADTWTYNASYWTYSVGTMVKDANSPTDGTAVLEKDVGAVNGGIYLIKYTVSSWTDGSFYISIGGSNGRIHKLHSALDDDVAQGYGNATYSDKIKATGIGNLKICPSGESRFTIDNITIEKIGDLQTNQINVFNAPYPESGEPTDTKINIFGNKITSTGEFFNDSIMIGGGQIVIDKATGGWNGSHLYINTSPTWQIDGSGNTGTDIQLLPATYTDQAIAFVTPASGTIRISQIKVRMKASAIITNIRDQAIRLDFYDNDPGTGKPNTKLNTQSAWIHFGQLSWVVDANGDNNTGYREYIGAGWDDPTGAALSNNTKYWIVFHMFGTNPTGGNIYFDSKADASTGMYATKSGGTWTLVNNKSGWFQTYKATDAIVKIVSDYSSAGTFYTRTQAAVYGFAEQSGVGIQGENRFGYGNAGEFYGTYGSAVFGRTLTGTAGNFIVESDDLTPWANNGMATGTPGNFTKNLDYSGGSSTVINFVRGGSPGSGSPGFGGMLNFKLSNYANSDTKTAGIINWYWERLNSGDSEDSAMIALSLISNNNNIVNGITGECAWFSPRFGYWFNGTRLNPILSAGATNTDMGFLYGVNVTNTDKNILAATGIGVGVVAGDGIWIHSGTELVTTVPRIFRVIARTDNSITLDRDCKISGASQTDFVITIYKDTIGFAPTDGINGQALLHFSHQNKPMQLGGTVNAVTSHSLTSEDLIIAGDVEFDSNVYLDANLYFGTTNNITTETLQKYINAFDSSGNAIKIAIVA